MLSTLLAISKGCSKSGRSDLVMDGQTLILSYYFIPNGDSRPLQSGLVVDVCLHVRVDPDLLVMF